MGVTGPALAGSAERRRAARWRAEQGWLARLLGANRAGLDALPGDGSCEGQRRFAFLLYRQENISERTPHLLGRAVLCRRRNESGGSEVWDPHAHERTCSVTSIVGT